MQFGIMLPHYKQVAATTAIKRVAMAAERLGYHSIWVSDHIVIPNEAIDRFGEVFYDPLAVLAYVAACTERVQLGSSVLILPYRNPIQVAKVTATVDNLSQGRLLVGVGVGALTAEFRTLHAPWEERGDYADEALRIFKELWTNPAPQFHGKYHQFTDIQCQPRPVQQPHPPLWIGGNSRRAVRRAAEFGDVWHPSRADVASITAMRPRLHSLAERAGRDPQAIGIAVRQPMKLTTAAGALPAWPLVGTAASVVDAVGRFRDAGVRHMVLDTFYSIPELSGESVDSMLETMERFASEVMPHCA